MYWPVFALASLSACTASSSSGSIIVGQDPYRFEYIEDLLELPKNAPKMLNGHGLAKDHLGNIYFTYELNVSETKKEEDKCLVKFNSEGKSGEMIGDKVLSGGTPHGLRITANGQTLWHVNNDGNVRATDLTGAVKWDRSSAPTGYESKPYVPHCCLCLVFVFCAMTFQ